MGDGRKLKEIIDSKPDMNVRKLAMAAGISATTLYTIIKKDTSIRFDFALRLANELNVSVDEICSDMPFTGDLEDNSSYPQLPEGMNSMLDESRIKRYLTNRMYPLMELFGKHSMPDIDNLLTSFYQLDDNARHEIIEMIKVKLKYNKDPERAEQVKSIKGWK